MTGTQKLIKYFAIAIAIALIISIISGIAGALGIFTFIFEGDGVLDDKTVYTLSEEIDTLDIEINGAELELKHGDEFSVESNLKYLKVKEKNGTLTLKEEKKLRNYTGALITLIIPESFEFDKIDISAGAGKLSLREFNARTLSLSLGAGDCYIENLCVSGECKIDGGVGEITIENGKINDLELQMGVGNITLNSELTGENDLEFGIGNAVVTLKGSKDNYRIKLEKGIGSISVNGKSINGNDTIGNGSSRIDVEGGIGEIRLIIEEK